jgi:hypothetical protein
LFLAGALLAISNTAPLLAQEEEAGGRAAEEHATEEHGGEHAYRNELAVFFGNTNRASVDAFTIGFDYARALSERFALGLFFDRATGDGGRAWVVGVPLYIETGLGHLSLTVGAGVEREEPFEDESSLGRSAEEESHEASTLFMGRFGAQYPFHFGHDGRFFVAPQVNLDITKSHAATVIGAIVGVQF